MTAKPSDPDDSVPRPCDDPPPSPRIVRSEDLLAGAVEIHIQHAGEIYRMRRTRSGKLILYK
jgi:hemin uptake protein HemP